MAIQEDASYFPNDILQIILLKLPVKSLIRFKSVCTSWNTLISDPQFVRIHHQLSTNSDSQNLFLQVTGDGFSFIRLEGRKFQTEGVIEKPCCRWSKHCICWKCRRRRRKHGNCWSHVMCVGDGLVLLGLDCKTYLLWNPCSGQHTILRFPYRFMSDLGFPSSPQIYGLCHDTINDDDFKVVVACETCYAVFSCKNKLWTKKKEFSYISGHDQYDSNIRKFEGLSADGAIYWVSYSWVWSEMRYEYYRIYDILCLDPKDDNFKIVQKPENVNSGVEFFLACLKGCLCLYCNGEDETTLQIWMKEKGGPGRNSWKVLMNIENLQTQPVNDFRLIAFTENKILIKIIRERFIMYNTSEKMLEEFEESQYCNLYPCLGSMFLPIMKSRPKRKRSQLECGSVHSSEWN